MSVRPAFAIAVGAYHRDACLRPLVKVLEGRGFEVRTMSLRSSGTAGVGLNEDVDGIRENLLQPLLKDGRKVILVLHSFAGASGGAAVKGLTPPERRAQGLAGSVVGVIYICAFIVPQGLSISAHFGGGIAPWARLDKTTGLVYCKTPRETFYADVKDEKLAQELASQVVGHSMTAFASALPPSALNDSYFDGCRAYIRTLNDNSLPVQLQDRMLSESELQWTVRSLESGHSPFASCPVELSNLLIEISDPWMTKYSVL